MMVRGTMLSFGAVSNGGTLMAGRTAHNRGALIIRRTDLWRTGIARPLGCGRANLRRTGLWRTGGLYLGPLRSGALDCGP